MQQQHLKELSDADKKDLTLLAFAETIMCHLANRTKAKTRRHTQLLAAIDRLQRVDRTYHGYMPDDFREEAETVLEGIEEHLLGLYKTKE